MVLRGAVDAGRRGAARPAGRDTSERECAEGVGLRAGLGCVMRIVAVFAQELDEAGVFRAAINFEQRRADRWNLDLD